MKYRIVKLSNTYKSGRVEHWYYPQYKFFLMWHYFHHHVSLIYNPFDEFTYKECFKTEKEATEFIRKYKGMFGKPINKKIEYINCD